MSLIMRSPELEKILEDHSLWVSTGGKKGTRLDLSGANLAEADMVDANFSGADLRRATLSEANLSGADFFRADLSGASLLGADLSWVDLSVAWRPND